MKTASCFIKRNFLQCDIASKGRQWGRSMCMVSKTRQLLKPHIFSSGTAGLVNCPSIWCWPNENDFTSAYLCRFVFGTAKWFFFQFDQEKSQGWHIRSGTVSHLSVIWGRNEHRKEWNPKSVGRRRRINKDWHLSCLFEAYSWACRQTKLLQFFSGEKETRNTLFSKPCEII